MTDFVETKETSFTYTPEKVETFLYEFDEDFEDLCEVLDLTDYVELSFDDASDNI